MEGILALRIKVEGVVDLAILGGQGLLCTALTGEDEGEAFARKAFVVQPFQRFQIQRRPGKPFITAGSPLRTGQDTTGSLVSRQPQSSKFLYRAVT